LTYLVTADDLKRTLGATIVTQSPKFAPDTRKLTLSTPVRAVPMFSIRAVPSEIEHGKRLMITARGLGRQLGGAVRIVENGKQLKTVALSQLSPSLYDYKTEPGTHILTFVPRRHHPPQVEASGRNRPPRLRMASSLCPWGVP
jgi:hypothetical protein